MHFELARFQIEQVAALYKNYIFIDPVISTKFTHTNIFLAGKVSSL